MQRFEQKVIYQTAPLTYANSQNLRPFDTKLIHACQHHKIILTVDHFDNQCKNMSNGKGCKYCQGYSLSDYEWLREQGYQADFYGKHICDTRGIAHRLV